MVNEKIFTPKSKAMDYNGFTQKILIDMIKDNEILSSLNKFSYIIQKFSENNSIEILIHNFIRIVLIKKRDEIESYKDLRPISILPAWLITLEKLAKPIVYKIINKKITLNQFGFKSGSDCNLAKTMIYYKSKKLKLNKGLLIDIRKAYDSVNRSILKESIIKEFSMAESDFLIYFIDIYENLKMVINNEEIIPKRGLPQGSALSPLFFNFYINGALNEINKIDNISAQAYADDLILQSNNIHVLQNGYNKTKELYKKLNLIINEDKSELITDIENEKIIDPDTGFEIIAKNKAKYLGQIINSFGIPTDNISRVQFGELIQLIKKIKLTKIAKIRLFHTYMKSKINHLIPLIAITGGISDLWKNMRQIIFRDLLEYSTLPRECASSFGLGYYDVIIRPVLKIIERNFNYTNNNDENEMLKTALVELLKKWLIVEPNQTDKVKNIIARNIEGNLKYNYKDFDTLISTECFTRLYKDHNINYEEIRKLKIIKSPDLIVLLSNQPLHQSEEIIKNYLKEGNANKLEIIQNIIKKLIIVEEYAKINEINIEEDIIKKDENVNTQLEKTIIKEIKIRNKLNDIKTKNENKVNEIFNNFLNQNKDNINLRSIENAIIEIRKILSECSKDKIKEIEVAIELENVYMLEEKYKKSVEEKNKIKKKVGRPKKELKNDPNQKHIDEIFNRILEI